MTRVAVVGAGLGGLSAAIRLASQGYHVEVFEQAPQPGGKAGQRRLGPFRFDTGPSLLTLAWVWDELFAAAGRRRQDYLEFMPLDPVTEYFWPGDRLSAPGSPEALARALAEKGWAPEKTTRDWLNHTRALWDLAGPLFLTKSLHDPATWASAATWLTLLQAGRLDSGRTLKKALESTFDDPKVRQFFSRYATYNGSDPSRIPATFAMIPWVEFGLGAWAVQGGIHALPQALAKLAGELGVTFHFSTPVQAIEHEGNRIKGIRVKDEVRPFDVVVSNTEVKRTYRLLEAGGPLGRRSQAWRRKYEEGQPSTSGVVFLWGMDTNFAELGHHNVFFSPDYNAEFLAMFDEGRLADDPTVYVNITCKDTPTDAPPGQENWFVLVNAPNDTGPVRKTGTEALARLRQAALGRIEANLGREVRSHIVQEQVLSLGESLYGLASHSALAAFDRHPNRAPGLKGLYLCGGSVHPGGGMPLATLSGKIAAELATKDFPLVQQKDGTP